MQVVRAVCEHSSYSNKNYGTVFVAFPAPPEDAGIFKVVRPCVYSFSNDGRNAMATTLTVNRIDRALKYVADVVSSAACVVDTADEPGRFANDVFAIANVKVAAGKQGGRAWGVHVSPGRTLHAGSNAAAVPDVTLCIA